MMKRYPQYKDSGVEWLGEVPAHWEVLTFQRCVSVREGLVDPQDATYVDMPLIAPNHVESGTGKIIEIESAAAQGADSGKYLCRAGDVIYSKIRPALRKVCIAPRDCLCSADMYPISGRDKLLNSYIKWFMLSEQFSMFAVLESERVAMPKINRESLKAVWLTVPPLVEQEVIASMLDRETAKIDTLIAEQQKLIALLAEKRQATISHAVTRGLDPHVPMKDSGVAWLGEVPAHWQVKQLKHVAKPGTAITYGIVQAGPHFEGGVPYIKTSDMSGKKLPLDGYALTSPEIDASYSRSKVVVGDIIIAIRATVGKCLPLPPELAGANLTQGTAKVSPGECVTTEFLLGSLRSTATQTYFDSMAKGATFKEITLDALRRTPVLVPPQDEQRQIVIFCEVETDKLDALECAAIRTVELLQERRSALITAAVTGQIDVRAD